MNPLFTVTIQAFIVSFLGVTTADDWSQRRVAPSPWAELEFDNIILTVPSKAVRDLEQVDELAKLWNNIMKTVAELATTPPKFPRKERIVIDVQISRGKHVRVRSNNRQLTQIISTTHMEAQKSSSKVCWINRHDACRLSHHGTDFHSLRHHQYKD